MVLVFFEPPKRKRRNDSEETADLGWAVYVLITPDQAALVLVAPVAEDGSVLREQGWGFALWDGDAEDGPALPDIGAFLLRWIKDIQPADDERIPVIDWRTGKQTGVAARDVNGGYDIYGFESRLSGALRGAAINTATGTVLGAVIPVPGLTSLRRAVGTLEELEKLLEPRGLLTAIVGAVVRVAAVHAGLGVIAPLIGQFAENTVSGLLRPDDAADHPVADKMLTGLKITAYAQAGQVAAAAMDLFVTPAIETALTKATAPVHRTEALHDQRALDRVFRDGAAVAHGPRRGSLARKILEEAGEEDSLTGFDPLEDGPDSATGQAVSPY